MKKTIMAATFAALGAGALAVGAADNVSLYRAESLEAITLDVIAACGPSCAGITLRTTAALGDGYGEQALHFGQSVAPMSRPLNTAPPPFYESPSDGICGGADIAAAEGVVVALESAGIVGNQNRVCNGTVGGDFSSSQGIDDAGGDWRNALRLIYAGMPSGQDDILLRDCNSSARRALVASWNDIFKGDCSGKDCNTDSHPSSDGPTPDLRYDRFNNVKEPGLRHAFRRDEAAGVTEIFLNLLGLPTINFLQAAPASRPAVGCNVNCQIAQVTAWKTLANSPFCNVRRPTDTYPPVTVPSWTNSDNSIKTNAEVVAAIALGNAKIVPEVINLGGIPTPLTATPPAVTHAPYTGWDHDVNAATPAIWVVLPVDVYYPEMQDQDPIRRKCVGGNKGSSTLPAEQVCSADAHLGLVLAISPPDLDATAAYPIAACTGFAQRATALVKGNGVGVLCPDGSPPVGSPSECLMPIINSTGSCACSNRGGYWGDNAGPNEVPVYTAVGGPAGSIIDGRVYNLQLRTPGCFLKTISRPDPSSGLPMNVQMAGSFYRIHSSRTLLPAPYATNFNCQLPTADRQIGCLVQASPCSVGFAGAVAADEIPDLTPANGVNDATATLAVNGVLPATSTIRHLFDGGTPAYALSRKLYLNTLHGFANPFPDATLPGVDGETELVRAFVTGVQPGGSSIPEDFGFVSLAGGPICEDFNETGKCPIQSGCRTVAGRTTCSHANTAACSDVVAGIPSGSTARCGDGIVQAGEACDDGNEVTDPAPSPTDPTDDTCSTLCTVTP